MTNPLLEYQDCIDMATRDAVLNIPEKDVLFCFGYCQMTVTNEERMWKQYHSLQLVEFLEFVGRLAQIKFKGTDMAFQPLT